MELLISIGASFALMFSFIIACHFLPSKDRDEKG